ncbi:carnitine/acyl carnitine carrier [Lentinula aciculospora]|uniref:Carnitine/acyl carnitine carrier n=1 Tax=Lentinula aciculospora TaxID=153920 RepID=A0A9W9A695_9AGAR|nr:carnitine/acyl carnitine carrier [Lentinula aciculospora]
MTEGQELNPTIDFIAGTMGGATSLVVGFPFDTVKVRFQNPEFAQRYSSTMNAFTTIVREEKFVGLFKGITSPLAAVALMNGLVFASYRFLLKIQLDNSNVVPTMSQIALAGAGCGAISSIITTPTELIKIRQQSLVTPTSARQVAWDIFKRSGVRGLYRGGTSTILRDSGYGAYFWAYEATCRYLNPRASSAVRSSETWHWLVEHILPRVITSFPDHALAGWIFTFPFDVVKTRMQGTEGSHIAQSLPIRLSNASSSSAPQPVLSQMYSTKATSSSMNPFRTTWSTIMNSYHSEGIRVFFRGLSPTLIRAIPVNMATFATFEAVVHALSTNSYPVL